MKFLFSSRRACCSLLLAIQGCLSLLNSRALALDETPAEVCDPLSWVKDAQAQRSDTAELKKKYRDEAPQPQVQNHRKDLSYDTLTEDSQFDPATGLQIRRDTPRTPKPAMTRLSRPSAPP